MPTPMTEVPNLIATLKRCRDKGRPKVKGQTAEHLPTRCHWSGCWRAFSGASSGGVGGSIVHGWFASSAASNCGRSKWQQHPTSRGTIESEMCHASKPRNGPLPLVAPPLCCCCFKNLATDRDQVVKSGQVGSCCQSVRRFFISRRRGC